jgi:GH25 family lysozyme M1 (1,4-beta-N-acetylmuramidase)
LDQQSAGIAVRLVTAVQLGEGELRAAIVLPFLLALVGAMGVTTFVSQPVTAVQSTLPGIDVSHHNGEPNWARVQQDGIRFVIAKVTEARSFLDDHYAANKRQVEALGMVFGAYHFARPDKTAGDAVAEADWFVANSHLSGKNLLPVLDLEDSGGLGTTRLTSWVKAWLNEVHSELGVKPMIYTTASFWKSYLGNSRWFADNGYRLWLARWTTATQPTVPATNWGGHGWTMWQYSSCGSVDGITGCVDLDRYRGTSLAPLKIKNNR